MKEDKPFFTFIFSSSNHDPFEIPQGIVTPIKYTKEQLTKYDAKELLKDVRKMVKDAKNGEELKQPGYPNWKE